MFVHRFLIRKPAAIAPFVPYFSAEPQNLAAQPLRTLTALEQMYAYWGSDRG